MVQDKKSAEQSLHTKTNNNSSQQHLSVMMLQALTFYTLKENGNTTPYITEDPIHSKISKKQFKQIYFENMSHFSYVFLHWMTYSQ